MEKQRGITITNIDKQSNELHKLLCTGRILHLTLKKQWFDLIAKGVKKEEYREVKEYWQRRFIDFFCGRLMGYKYNEDKYHFHNHILQGLDFVNKQIDWRSYDKIVFKNGYAKNAPTLIVEFKGIKIGKGHEAWGAISNEVYFVIKLGKVLFNSTELKPCA